MLYAMKKNYTNVLMSCGTLNVRPYGFKDILLMRIWLMGKNLGSGHDVIKSRCNPVALSPISRRLRLSGMERQSTNPLEWIRGGAGPKTAA